MKIKDIKRYMKYLQKSYNKNTQPLLLFTNKDNNTLLETGSYEFKTSCSIPLTLPDFKIDFLEFKNFLKNSKDDLEFEFKDSQIVIKSGTLEKSFENIKNPKIDKTYKDYEDMFNNDVLVNKDDIPISKVIYDGINPNYALDVYKGLLVDYNNHKIISTDTISMTINEFSPNSVGLYAIPKKAIVPNIILKKVKIGKEFVSFYVDNDIKITSKLYTNNITSDYQRVIKQEFNISIKINGIELKKATEKIKECKLIFQDGICIVQEYDDIKNKIGYTQRLSCDYNIDAPLEIVIDAKRVHKAIDTNEIEIFIQDNNHPIKIVSSEVYTLIMPIPQKFLYDLKDIKQKLEDTPKDFNYNSIKSTKVIKAKPKVQEDESKLIKELRTRIKELEDKLLKYEDNEF